jgi:hypothetical protein
MQRWINRDPLGDEAVVQEASKTHDPMRLNLLQFQGRGNLYGFNYNNPCGYVDNDGRAAIAIPVGGMIVIGGVAITVAICNAIPSCHRWLVNQIANAIEACKSKLPPPPLKKCYYACPLSNPVYTEQFPGQFSGGCPQVRAPDKNGKLVICPSFGPF